MWWTYRNTKAKRELGFKPSPHEEALEETIAWYREREGSELAARGRAPAAAVAGRRLRGRSRERRGAAASRPSLQNDGRFCTAA